jgi:uracil-DNA glycosylase
VIASVAPACGGRLAESIGSQVERHGSDWTPLLRSWRDSAEGQRLIRFVADRMAAGAKVYPSDVFRALACTPLSQMQVLILGQDPYHGPGQAEGLAFSVPPGQRHPPSLRNIFKELRRDLGIEPPEFGSLLPWARRGVLLLNTSLTVEDGLPASHSKTGWEVLTDRIVIAAAGDARPKVFMLWGAQAQAKLPLIAASGRPHLVLQCNHPSPLSATRGPMPFIGCAHFSRAKAFLEPAYSGDHSFDWRLDDGPLLAGGPDRAADGGIVSGSPRRGARVAKGGRL